MNISHQSKRAVYVVGGLYLAVGLALTAHGALGGRITETLCGFLITNVVIMGGWLVWIVAGLSDRTAEAMQRLDRIGESLRRIEDRRAASLSVDDADSPEASLDLTVIGSGDPSVLTGAVLDRSVFPRLATSMDRRSSGADVDEKRARADGPHPSIDPADDRDGIYQAGGPGRRNLLREWRVALREGDVDTCRRVLSTLLDTAEPTMVADFQTELDRLVHRVEGDLRRRFADRVRAGDYSAAIAVGREILAHLPESSIAHDYRQLEPHLIRHADDSAGTAAPGHGAVLPSAAC